MNHHVVGVNIFWQTFFVPPRARKPYHHGDLRAALLDAAIELIAERGLHNLSLRECARRAGVSHAAPARHFADKNALLVAIAELGFEQLAEAGRVAMRGESTARERLDAYGAAYVRFAVENPVLFRVMFTTELDKPSPEREIIDNGAFALLVESARAIVGEGAEELATVAAWSLPHGLAMLILDGRIPRERVATPEAAAALAKEVFMQWRGPLA